MNTNINIIALIASLPITVLLLSGCTVPDLPKSARWPTRVEFRVGAAQQELLRAKSLLLRHSFEGQKEPLKAEKEPLKAEPSAPPQTTKTALFDSIQPTNIAVVVCPREWSPGSAKPSSFDKEQPLRDSIEDQFSQALLSKGYVLSSRSDMAAVLKEIGFQNSGITQANAAQLGKVLNVSSILILRIVNHSDSRRSNHGPMTSLISGSLSARLIELNKGEILWIGNHSGSKVVTLPGSYQDPNNAAFDGANESLFADISRQMAALFPKFAK